MDQGRLRKSEALRRGIPGSRPHDQAPRQAEGADQKGCLGTSRSDVLEAYKATGAKWQSRINNDLRKAMKLN